MNRMHRTQSDHTSLDPLSLVIQSNQARFHHQIRETYTKYSVGAKTWMFTIYMARQTGESRSRIAFSICTNQFYLPKNGRKGPKLVSKRWLWWKGTRILVKKMFHLEKEVFLFICSVALRNFPLERTKKSRSIYFPTGISGNFLSYLTFDC